jgi:hypothetical protein
MEKEKILWNLMTPLQRWLHCPSVEPESLLKTYDQLEKAETDKIKEGFNV